MSLRTETTLPPGRHDEKNEIKLAYYLLFLAIEKDIIKKNS
jgi:hypothetical protein